MGDPGEHHSHTNDLILIPPPPRTVPSGAVSGPADTVVIIIGLSFAILGMLAGWALLRGLQVDLALDLTGQTVEGEIIDMVEDTSVSVNKEHPITLVYSYNVGGEPLQGRSNTMDWALVATLEKNPKANIEFAPWNPKWSRVQGATRNSIGYWGLFILLLPLVGFAMVAAVWIKRSGRAKIYRTGQGVSAALESIGLNRSITVNGRHPTIIRWSFEVNGERFEGNWTGFKIGNLNEESKKIPVIYNPNNPKQNVRFWG